MKRLLTTVFAGLVGLSMFLSQAMAAAAPVVAPAFSLQPKQVKQ